MDLFQRLLGTLQRTVDYISTFTTYLLGNEAHPGAQETGSKTETVPCGNYQDCDVETAHYGDISSRGDAKVFERPPVAEAVPPNQEVQEASGKDLSFAHAITAVLSASELLHNEGQEDFGQKPSEPPNFLANAPKPSSWTTGSTQQRDLERTRVTGKLHQWEPEGSTRMGAVQQELLEEMTEVEAWKPEKPSAGGQEHEELGRAGEAERSCQKEQKETEGDEQEVPGGAESDEEEQRGLDGAVWTGGFQPQGAKPLEALRSEPEGGFVGVANDQEEKPDIYEEVHPAVSDCSETGRDQEGEPREAETRSHPPWEPEEKVPLEVPEETLKGVTEEEGGQQRGTERSETEGAQLGELEGFVRNEKTQWRNLEGDNREQSVAEEQREDGTALMGRWQQEMAKMAEHLRSELDGQLPGGTNMEESQLEESAIKAGEVGVQPAGPNHVETGGDLEGRPEGEAEARSQPQWELEERVTSEAQEESPKGITGEGASQQSGFSEEAEVEAHQQRALEGLVGNEATQRGKQENKGEEKEAPGGDESVVEEQRGEGTMWTGRSQPEVDKMAEGQWLELEGQLAGQAANNQQGGRDMETGNEGAQPSILDGAETRGDQQGGPKQEAEARSSPHREPEEMTTLEAQDEDAKRVTEKGGSWQKGLEGDEKEESQQREQEGFLRDERTQWRKQRGNKGEEQEATGGEQQSGDGASWTGRSQQEVAKMAEGQWLEVEEGPLAGRAKAKNIQQGEPGVESGEEGSQQAILDGAGPGGDQQGGLEGEAEVGRNLQWEPEKTVTLEEHTEEGNGQQQGLEGDEECEGHQRGKLEGLVGNEAENEEDEQEEQMGGPSLARDQLRDPEVSAGITVLEEATIEAMTEDPEVQGQEARETKGTERNLLRDPLGDKAHVDPGCPAEARAFPAEVPSLDTSAQKERVLLRRKSSLRRAPSLKRPRPLTETPPPQEISMEENTSPSQPPSSGRPKLRHAGFGPMHPNMMAELQMRLRKPQ